MVMIPAFQAGGPGSIPGRRILGACTINIESSYTLNHKMDTLTSKFARVVKGVDFQSTGH